MRRHRVLELEEVSENAFLCTPEGCHLGAGGCAAKDRHKGDDEQLAKVMSRVLGAGIGDVFEGGQEQMHDGDGLRRKSPPSESIVTPAASHTVQCVTAICDSPVHDITTPK